jgi:hypothetical protein
MAYSDVKAFSRLEIYEENMDILNKMYSSKLDTRYLVVCMTPVDANGDFVDISSDIPNLFTDGHLRLVSYFGGIDYDKTHTDISISSFYSEDGTGGKTILFNQVFFIYIKLVVASSSATGDIYGNVSPCLTLDDTTEVSTNYGSAYGFDSQAVFYLFTTS